MMDTPPDNKKPLSTSFHKAFNSSHTRLIPEPTGSLFFKTQ
jgi:hypothetical protein